MLRTLLSHLLNIIGGGNGLFQPNGKAVNREPKSVLVLTPGEIPTTDLYLQKQLKQLFDKEVYYLNTLKESPKEISIDNDSMVVIVRHAPSKWLRWLEQQNGQSPKVVFLMDDDIPAAATASELPFRYAIKTAWRYACTRRLLGRLCNEIWVSTPELQRRYSESSPRLWEPGYVTNKSTDKKTTAVYFYHGSWAHRREIEWLVPIVQRVQEASPYTWFEIMGTDRVRRLFHGIPRVRVIHPMPWKDYLAYAETVQYQIGLAPCFDTNFNRARSHSKVFDINRLGAVGIYSNVTPYVEKVVHGKTGLLCANDQDKWIATLTLLLQDQDLRTSLYLEARDWCNNSSFNLSL